MTIVYVQTTSTVQVNFSKNIFQQTMKRKMGDKVTGPTLDKYKQTKNKEDHG